MSPVLSLSSFLSSFDATDSHLLSTSFSPRLPESDPDLDQFQATLRRKVVYFRSQPEMKKLPGRSILKVSPRSCLTILRSISRWTSRTFPSLPQISRANIFESSYDAIMELELDDLRKDLRFAFDGEDGLDYGGVSRSEPFLCSFASSSELPNSVSDLLFVFSREFFYLLGNEIANPMYTLWQNSSTDSYNLQINPDSSINPEHLSCTCTSLVS